MVRSFSIRDFAKLQKNRDSGTFLNSRRTLLWGKGLISVGALSAPISNTTGVFTAISQTADGIPCVGQAIHSTGAQFAYFTFLTQNENSETISPIEVIQNLSHQAGERGAFCMISEVDEESVAFNIFKKAKFNVFSHQQIWEINNNSDLKNGKSQWQEASSEDEFNIGKLYNAIVPAMVQKIEAPPWKSHKGFVNYQDNQLMAFVEIISGPNGVWVQPYIHPDLDHPKKYLIQLFNLLGNRSRKPIFICIRAYQSWLNSRLESMSANLISNQVLMAKHMTIKYKTAPLPLSTINHTEPTTPYSNPTERVRDLR
jgi:hypothetical protein